MDTAKSMLALLLGRTWPLFPVFHQFLEVSPMLSCVCVARPVKSALQWSALDVVKACTSSSVYLGEITRQHFFSNCKTSVLLPVHLFILTSSLCYFFSAALPFVSPTAVQIQRDE